jgi:uncharacterized membrane protein
MVLKYAVAYIATGMAFAAIDAVWLRTMFTRLYQPEIGEMLAPNLRLGPAVIFYLLFILGLVYFAVLPALRDQNWSTALINGALFGFFTYMTYDLTNFATLKIWSLKVTILDIIWGSFLGGISALLGWLVTSRLALPRL